jgi:hypothetical protein
VHAKRHDLFVIWAARHLTHYEWGPDPLVNHIGPPGVAAQARLRANTPTTLKKVCDP